jgi:hypothetical protein
MVRAGELEGMLLPSGTIRISASRLAQQIQGWIER